VLRLLTLITPLDYYFEDLKIIDSLTDNSKAGRIEIDSNRFLGPYFEDIDNRAFNLHLDQKLKNPLPFHVPPDGSISVPAENVIQKNDADYSEFIQAGKPSSNIDMIEQGKKHLMKLPM